MKIGSFLKYVEIQTKAASMIPLAAGTVYALYRYESFNLTNFVLMLVSLLTFDMNTTAINNFIDYKRARKKSGYGYESHNAIVRDNIKESHAAAVIVILTAIAVISGLLLYLNTNAVVLLIGAVSFAVGVLYSAGPVPISRTPFGEVFSGLFMGFLIPFLSFFIHVLDRNIVLLSYDNPVFTFQVDIMAVLSVFIYSVPAVAGIANIMLANNICDMEDDLENNRFTLPIYIGKKKALVVFQMLYYISYAAILLGVILKILPVTALLFLITLIPVRKNIQTFLQEQSKKDTFVVSVQNFAIMNVSLILTMVLGIGVNLIF